MRRLGMGLLVVLTPFMMAKGCGDKSGDSGEDPTSPTATATGTGTGTGTATGGTATGTGTGSTTGYTGSSACDGSLCAQWPDGWTHNHTVGVSDCPDPLAGSLVLQNQGTNTATYTLTAGQVPPTDINGVLMEISPDTWEPSATGTVAAGASATIPVAFSCYTTTSFTTEIEVMLEDGSDALTTQVPIQVDIQ